MNIAEFFVNIGVKGTSATKAALGEVTSGLSKAKEMSLEAKVGILGLFYGFQQAMSGSQNAGAAINELSVLTGQSTQKIQQYEWAIRQVGGASEDVDGSLKGLQNVMSNLALNKGAPESLAAIAASLRDVKDAAGHTGLDQSKLGDVDYLMQRFQAFAQMKGITPAIKNHLLQSLGLGQGTIAAMMQGAFDPAKMSKAPTYSDGEIKSLTNAKAQWSNIGQTIEMAFGHFNAKHGVQLAKDIGGVVKEISKLADAFMKFSEAVQLFKAIDAIFQGWAMIFKGITDSVKWLQDNFENMGKLDKNGKSKSAFPTWDEIKGRWHDMQNGAGDFAPDKLNKVRPPGVHLTPVQKNPQKVGAVNVNVYQQGVKDTHHSVNLMKQEFNKAGRLSFAQTQVV